MNKKIGSLIFGLILSTIFFYLPLYAEINLKGNPIDPDTISTSEPGTTPLMFAAADGNNKTIKLLLSKGFDINAKNSKDNTALMFAVLNDNKEITELLLSKGADINAKPEALSK